MNLEDNFLIALKVFLAAVHDYMYVPTRVTVAIPLSVAPDGDSYNRDLNMSNAEDEEEGLVCIMSVSLPTHTFSITYYTHTFSM